MQTPVIESIDLQSFLQGSAEQRLQVAAKVDQICRSIGFLVIENHDVDESIISNIWNQTSAFFDLPFELKKQYIATDPDSPRGYFPQGVEALAQSLGNESPVDAKESFGIGPLDAPAFKSQPNMLSDQHLFFHYGENHWPTEPVGLKQSMLDYYHAMETLGSRLLTLFASALKLDADYFEPFHSHHMGALRLLNYPMLRGHAKVGQLGAGEHSDYGSITILKPDPDVAGLEIKLPSGIWAKAPLVKDGFIINIGDMMSRWTNDKWVSTVHRVIQSGASPDASSPSKAKRSRQSLAFFFNTNFDARIQCIETCLGSRESPKYPPVDAGEYLMQRFNSAKR